MTAGTAAQPFFDVSYRREDEIANTVGSDVASAATINLDNTTGDYVVVSGTTTITGIILGAGHRRLVRFSGALTLTHGSSLVLPGAQNITTVAGDVAEFVGEASSVVRCVSYDRGTGAASSAGEQVKFCTTQFDAVTGTTGATLTDIVGLTGFNLIAGATYTFEAALGVVGTANSGVKFGFELNTATLTSIEYQAVGTTASAVVSSRGTTAASGTAVFGSTAAHLVLRVTGRMVVNAAGTLDWQAAQNAAHSDTTSVFVGSWVRLKRIS